MAGERPSTRTDALRRAMSCREQPGRVVAQDRHVRLAFDAQQLGRVGRGGERLGEARAWSSSRALGISTVGDEAA